MKNAMRKSSRPYVGPVPSHWRDVQLKHVLRAPITDGPHETPTFVDEGFPFLSVDGIQDGRLVFEGCRFVSKSAFDEYRRKAAPEVGDLLMGKAASTGKIARLTTNIEFAIWSPLALIKLKASDIDSRFAEYVLKTPALQQQIDDLCNANTQKNIGMGDIPKLAFALPPICEQEAIANFLDEQTARIDALIAEKAQLGRSLEEFRLSAIHEALSVGLDREAPTVDTGDEWFARVPTHWAFCPLNYRYEVQLGKMLDEKRITGAHLLPYLRNTDVQWDRINSDSLPAMDIAPTEMPRYSVKAGDLLVCEGGEVGRAAIWEGPENAIGYQKALHRVRPRTTNDVPRFLFYALFDSAKRGRFESRDKATIAHLTAEAFRRYRFTFPPYAEQTAIVRHLDSLTSKIDGLQRHCTEHIERLREYRASLISAAVTGQLDINSYKEAA